MTNTKTLAALVTAAFAGSALAADRGDVLHVATGDTQVVAEHPRQTYTNGPISVGASAKITGSEAEGNEDVNGQPKRAYITFPKFEGTPATARLTFYVESGTAWSSKDNTICGRPLTVEVHALYSPNNVGTVSGYSPLNLETLTWSNQFSGIPTTYVGKVTVNEPCSTTSQNPSAYTVDVTGALALGQEFYGFMLRADARGELSPTVLKTAQERWDAQTDVVIGTKETGNPAMLTVTYKR